MSPRTTDKKRHPVTVHFEKSKQSERDKLWTVYSYALRNWAVRTDDIIRGTKMDPKEVRRLTMKLARTGLLEGTHVNDEKTITWQTWYDVDNDRSAIKNGTKAFNEMFPKTKMPEPKPAPNRNAATGSRYEAAQMKKAVELRKSGLSWKAVAAEVGVKSPFHFSKVVRASYKGVK